MVASNELHGFDGGPGFQNLTRQNDPTKLQNVASLAVGIYNYVACGSPACGNGKQGNMEKLPKWIDC